MSYAEYFIIPITSFFLVSLDTAFFSFYEIFNATIISSFCVLAVLCILGLRKQAMLFGSFSILFLAIFSSMPIYSLMLAFLGIPILIFHFRQKVFFEASFGPALVILFLANLLFRLLLLPMDGQWSSGMLASILFFPILNVAFCLVIFLVTKKLFANYIKK